MTYTIVSINNGVWEYLVADYETIKLISIIVNRPIEVSQHGKKFVAIPYHEVDITKMLLTINGIEEVKNDLHN